MPREKNNCFDELMFTLIKAGKKYSAFCPICKRTLSNTAATRLKAHRRICQYVPPGIKSASRSNNCTAESTNSEGHVYFTNQNHEEMQVLADCTVFQNDAEMQESQIPTNSSALRSKKAKKMDTLIDNESEDQTEELNTKLSSFFFGCNIPFDVVESDHFKNLIKALRPAYVSQLPSRKALSTTLLDEEYQRCADLSVDLMSSESVLLIDGWKNASSNSTKTVVSMLHFAKGSQAFLNAWDVTCECETAVDKLAEIVNESITMAKDLYGTCVYAVVSDGTAAEMMEIGSSISVWHSNCGSHIANMLAEDVMDKELVEKVQIILKEFKQTEFERALIDKGGPTIKTPCETRWCSYGDSFACLLTNVNYMKILIVNDDRFTRTTPEVKTLIFNDDFVADVEDNMKLLDPICNLIYFAQKSDLSSADVTHLWLSLEFPEKFLNRFQAKLESRRKMALNIYSLCTYYLHPKYHNYAKTTLSVEQFRMVQHFLLENLNSDGIRDLHGFQEKAGVFKTLFSKHVDDPVVFWDIVKIHHPNLSHLALKLERIPSSSAQIERISSNWSFVHSPSRHRLDFAQSRKLLHAYYTNKIIDSNKSDEY